MVYNITYRYLENLRYTAVPSAPAEQIARYRQAYSRSTSVLFSICQDYLGPDMGVLTSKEDYALLQAKSKKVSKAVKRFSKVEGKKNRKQMKSGDQFAQADMVKNMAQAGKAFIKAARAIKQKGGHISLDMEQLIRCLRLGHQEFPEDSLINSIFKKLSGNSREKIVSAADSEVYDKIKQAGKLPTPSRKAFQVFRLANDPEVDIADLVAVIKTDPAITTRILKIANSAYYKTLKPIGSVQDATIRLGMNMVKKISLGISLIANHKKGLCPNFDYELFWSDSLARAVAAHNIADVRQSPFNSDEAFTVGLLSQIGRLGLALAYPKEYGQVLEKDRGQDMPSLSEQEKQIFGIDHNDLAAEMMADWHLPEVFCKAVRFQDSLEDEELLACGSPEYELAALLQWPAKMSHLLTCSEVDRDYLEDMVQEAERMGLSGNKLAQRFDTITHEWVDMGKILELKIRKVLSWHEIYSQFSSNSQVILAGI
ncbi:MAG: HDOD domain-containing protein [Planctomycetes bacterium]|nr:HDOD domain-containing protein [Planctomycetota bacterium]